jgi:hypothetical protein
MSDRVTATNPEADFEIFVMKADGSHQTQITFNAMAAIRTSGRWTRTLSKAIFPFSPGKAPSAGPAAARQA